MMYGSPSPGQYAPMPMQARPLMPMGYQQQRPYGVPMYPMNIQQRPAGPGYPTPQLQQPRPMMNQPTQSKALPLHPIPSPPIGTPPERKASPSSSMQGSPISSPQEMRKTPSPIHVNHNNFRPMTPPQQQIRVLSNQQPSQPVSYQQNRPPLNQSRSSMILIQPIPHPSNPNIMINPITGNVMKVFLLNI
jgi:hypothetical protein